MKRKFSGALDEYVRQAGLPLRRVASGSGIPHQTLFNWMKGTQPRWHAALPDDIQRLGLTLGLNDDEITLLLRLAGCAPAQAGCFDLQEASMESTLHIPKGWHITGDAPEKYEIGVDPAVTHDGHACITLKAGPEPTDFAALAQVIKADAYHGKRLRFSAAVRTAGVENRAALFMRVSDGSGKMLAFDNMRSRPITGDSDWDRHAIVLDIAEEAEDLIFGILLSEKGQAWMAEVRLEPVEKDVPTTDMLAEIAAYFPVNLEFTE